MAKYGCKFDMVNIPVLLGSEWHETHQPSAGELHAVRDTSQKHISEESENHFHICGNSSTVRPLDLRPKKTGRQKTLGKTL